MRPMSANMNGSWCPSSTTNHQQPQQLHHPLKINKDSHIIKKPSSSTTSSSSSSSLSHSPPPLTPPKPQTRHPVIIYTHSPKVIHTHPKDFMALVQKLTGMSRTDQKDDKKTINNSNNNNGNLMSQDRNYCQDPPKVENRSDYMKIGGSSNEENESLSGITTSEHICSNAGENGQVNSNNCLGPPPMAFHRDQPSNYFSGNVGINNHNELLCCTSSIDPTYDFIDFNAPLN